MTRVVADMTGFEHEFVKVAKDGKEEYKQNVYAAGLFPFLKDESSGEGLSESLAIARFMCNSKPEAGLYGTSTEEIAQVDEVLEKHLYNFSMIFGRVFPAVFGFTATNDDDFKDAMKRFKDHLMGLDALLKDKSYFVNERLTLADVYVAVSLNLPMATIIDAGFRKALPNLVKWYESVRAHGTIEKYLGKARFIGKPMKPKTE